MANYIAVDRWFNAVKRRNFYMYEVIAAFVWMCFHFTVVYFFMIKLESMALVWIFLGFWNFISFVADSPIWVFQKYFDAKTIFKFWAYMMLFVALIFLYFIYSTSTLEFWDMKIFSKEAFSWLISSAFNIVLLIIAVTFYGIIKELSEVTSNSYIMNNSDPSEYSELFSKRSIFFGIGSWVGLISSWVFLAFKPILAVIILVLVILFYIFFIIRYFDSWDRELWMEEFRKIKLIVQGKKEVVNNKQELVEKTKDKDVIYLKPIDKLKRMSFKEIYTSTIADMKSFLLILFQPPYNLKLLVIWWIFVIFWFWDTFVTTFLIDFLDWIIAQNTTELAKFKLQNILTAYVFIGLFCVPAFLWQIPLVQIWNKYWIRKVMIPWLLFSWVSMFVFWFSESIYVLLWAWMANGIGYAACMPISQWEFSNEYNITYSKKNNLKQIDANASSAPIKMLSNLANVLGLAVGWVLLEVVWYTGTFCMLALVFLWLFALSLLKKFRL